MAKTMILIVGEVLFDVFPEGKRIGGAPFNFAFHLNRLGFAVRFVSRIGDDEAGREILAIMQQSGLSTEGVQIDPDHPTGTVQVTLDKDGVPEYDILREVAYDYLAYSDTLRQLLDRPPALMYYGTLIQRATVGQHTLQQIWHEQNKTTTNFYDVNLRPDCYVPATVRTSLAHTNILKLNQDELLVLGDILGYDDHAPDLPERIRQQYDLELLAVTAGETGSTIYTRNTQVSQDLTGTDYGCVDTVGAGDAFAAVLAAGYLRNIPMADTLKAATAFAGRICGLSGAVPENHQADYDAVWRQLNQPSLPQQGDRL